MRRYIYLSVVFCLCVFSALSPVNAEQSGAQTHFFSAIQDMPLMPGLTELADQTVVFDKPQGRIIESVAAIDSVSLEDIRRYYEAALPQLGWSKVSDDLFVRQNEHLQMSFERIEHDSFLRVMIFPK